jgi:hypothetical protein
MSSPEIGLSYVTMGALEVSVARPSVDPVEKLGVAVTLQLCCCCRGRKHRVSEDDCAMFVVVDEEAAEGVQVRNDGWCICSKSKAKLLGRIVLV